MMREMASATTVTNQVATFILPAWVQFLGGTKSMNGCYRLMAIAVPRTGFQSGAANSGRRAVYGRGREALKLKSRGGRLRRAVS
jgi:hypothetical protein